MAFATAADVDSRDGSETIQHSETNVQVAGVDEDDIVETDGHFIYSLRGSELTIVQSLPVGEMEVVSRTQVEGTPIGMYLNGDRIAVISEEAPIRFLPYLSDALAETGEWIAGRSSSPSSRSGSRTFLTVLDVADRSARKSFSATEFESRFVDSRRIGGQVYLIFENALPLPRIEPSCDDSGQCAYETEAEFTRRVRSGFADWLEMYLPEYSSYDGDGNFVRGGPLLLPEEFVMSGETLSSIKIVAAIDMDANEPGLTAVSGVTTGSGSILYASEQSLYVLENGLSTEGLQQTTKILKFNWSAGDKGVEFAATGEIPGRVLNQFSIDEYQGRLRVTSEIRNAGSGNFSGRAETGVYVLEEDTGVLEFVGSLQNLAVGNQVKSVRYFGDRVFITTFDAIDPLYAIDLSDPSNPRAVGHVPIVGYSRYMQFIGPDRLLTIGVNSTNGSGGRAMVALFDVADLTSPRLIDFYNLPRYSSSEASSDHHAFGWFANHELLSVPSTRSFLVRVDEDGDGYAEKDRSIREDDLFVLHVGTDASGNDTLGNEGISLRGTIRHEASVRRSVSVNDFIFSIGEDGVRAVHVAEAGTVVSEALFDWEVVTSEPMPLPFDRAAMVMAARELLTLRGNVDPESLLFVTTEQRDSSHEFVFRAGEEYYRLRGESPEELALVDDAFSILDRPRHNVVRPLDVNADGIVTAGDALVVINELARETHRLLNGIVLRQLDTSQQAFSDTNGDGSVTAT